MNEIKDENLLAGLTNEAQDGKESLTSMKHGKESQSMLLAVLNSPLEDMINSQQAEILATCRTTKGVGTLIIIYGTQPTNANTLEMIVGNENQTERENNE